MHQACKPVLVIVASGVFVSSKVVDLPRAVAMEDSAWGSSACLRTLVHECVAREAFQKGAGDGSDAESELEYDSGSDSESDSEYGWGPVQQQLLDTCCRLARAFCTCIADAVDVDCSMQTLLLSRLGPTGRVVDARDAWAAPFVAACACAADACKPAEWLLRPGIHGAFPRVLAAWLACMPEDSQSPLCATVRVMQ
jgi:hypothetical protein